jgi:glycosyltransferase involved in cell wall biosynthesis
VGDKVKFCGGVPFERIAEVMVNADIGVVPKRANSFGNEAYSTKIMEFMSQGVPVVVSQTKVDTYYFDDSVVRFFPSGDSQAMAQAILELRRNPELRESIVGKALEYTDRNGWAVKKHEYLSLLDNLTSEMLGVPDPAMPPRPKNEAEALAARDRA